MFSTSQVYLIKHIYKIDILNKSVLNKEQRRCMTDRHKDSKNRQFIFCFRALLSSGPKNHLLCIDQSGAL